MVAQQFLEYINKYQVTTYVGVEDFADKFNFLYSVIVFMLSATIITLKQYLLKPISCYLPNDPGGTNLLEYVENYCWVQGTLPFNGSDRLPETEEGWESVESRRILYYQWVPFVLGLQCIMFYLPRVFWQLFCYNRSGTDLQHLVISANEAVHSDLETRNKMVTHLARTLEQLLFQHREYRTGKFAELRRKAHNILTCFGGKRLGTWFVVKYIILKVAYLTNAILQLVFMQYYLQFNDKYLFFGYEVARNILSGRDWRLTLVFPRVTFCPVRMKQMGAYNGVSAQCVLPANMLNEKIFIFLWFWVLLTLAITTVSMPVWFYRVLLDKGHVDFVKKFLKIGEQIDGAKDRPMINRFTQKFLRHDGIFILRMIAINAGDMVASDIVCELWKIFKSDYLHKDLGVASDEDRQSSKKANMVKLDRTYTAKTAYKRQPTAPPGDKASVQCEKDVV